MYKKDWQTDILNLCDYSWSPMTCGFHVIRRSSVYSWRGKRDNNEVRKFERIFSERKGQLDMIWHDYKQEQGGYGYLPYFLQPYSSYDSPPTVLLDSEYDTENFRRYHYQALIAKANEARFALATFLAEGKETLSLVSSLKDLAKGFLKKGDSLTGSISSSWLMYRYGLLPLILTVKDLMDLFEEYKPPEKYQDYAELETKDTRICTYTYWGGYLSFTERLTTKLNCGSALWVKSQNDLSPYGTGFQDVIAAYWELTTLSFVADWFFDVGQWLGSLRDTNLEILRQYQTVVVDRRVETYLSDTNMTFDVKPTSGAPYIQKDFYMRRYTNEELELSRVPLVVPTLLSTARKLDAAALSFGAISKLLRRK